MKNIYALNDYTMLINILIIVYLICFIALGGILLWDTDQIYKQTDIMYCDSAKNNVKLLNDAILELTQQEIEWRRLTMPYPNEHSARLQDPAKFDPKSFRRTAGGTIFGRIKVPSSVGIIWGKLKGKAAPHQMPMPTSLRFDEDKWTVAQAKEWLKKNNLDDNVKEFEPAKDNNNKS